MGFMEWDESYGVNVAAIDDQHKKIFQMISNFYNTMQKDNHKAIDTLLKSLLDYTNFHFGTEEKYFDKFGYSNSEEHKKEHLAFVEKVMDVKKRFDEGKLVISMEITNFLKNWLIEHIKGIDKKYSKCFNDNGLR